MEAVIAHCSMDAERSLERAVLVRAEPLDGCFLGQMSHSTAVSSRFVSW